MDYGDRFAEKKRGRRASMVNIRLKGGYDDTKMSIQAAREAKVKMNKMRNKGDNIDYLTEAR